LPSGGAEKTPRGLTHPLSSETPVVRKRRPKEVTALSILWIILIIVLVLALLGFFSRGRW
jgi:flagellar basal body-associated protein FliL